MEEKIRNICTELNDGKITVSQATEQLFYLFSVSGSVIEQEFIDAYMENAKKYYPKKRPTIL